MTVQQFFAKIETPVTDSKGSVANDMLGKINRFKSIIEHIKEQNLDLERMRDQYIIHLQQCQEDHEILRNLYKSLKQKLDRKLSELEQSQGTSMVAQIDDQLQQQQPVGISIIHPEPLQPKINEKSKKVTLKASYEVNGIICSVAYDRHGKQVAFSTGLYLFILDAEMGKTIAEIPLPVKEDPQKVHCRSIVYSPDDKYIAMTGSQNQIYLVSTSDYNDIKVLEQAHTAEPSSLIFSTDNKKLISGGFDGLIIIWDLATLKPIERIPMTDSNQRSDNAIVGISAAPPDPNFDNSEA